MADPDTSRSGGELVSLRRTIDDDDVRLESPTLEALTAAQEAEAADLLAGLFAAASTRRGEHDPLKDAA